MPGVLVLTEIKDALSAFVIRINPVRRESSESAVDKYNSRLQALALVNRHDLDGFALAFEALNVTILARWLLRFQDILRQGRHQVGQLTAGRPCPFEKDLKEMQVIRRAPARRP